MWEVKMVGPRSKFTMAVVRMVQAIPAGRVVSYGQVAAYVGVPRGARQVGWVLRQVRGVEHPWWRVINNAGRISIKGNMYHDANEQRDLLRKEGVEIGEGYEIEIEKYRFAASEKLMRKWGLSEEYLNAVWNKFGRNY
jgi:methylated-DNA-protein-cysteine methyltransferase-like protein